MSNNSAQLQAWGIAWKSSFTGLEGRGAVPIFAKWSEAEAYCKKLDAKFPGIRHWPHSEFPLIAYNL